MTGQVLALFVLLLSIPAGFLIAWLCADELIQGRIWFKLIALVSILIFIWAYFYHNFPISFTMIFAMVVSLISLYKSHDRKWTKRRI